MPSTGVGNDFGHISVGDLREAVTGRPSAEVPHPDDSHFPGKRMELQ